MVSSKKVNGDVTKCKCVSAQVYQKTVANLHLSLLDESLQLQEELISPSPLQHLGFPFPIPCLATLVVPAKEIQNDRATHSMNKILRRYADSHLHF